MTRPETSASEAKSLYSELESIADLKGFSEIYTNTSISRNIMERLGWKYIGKNSKLLKNHTYKRELTIRLN